MQKNSHRLLTPAPKNPFMYYSAFKLAIYFKNNPTRCVSVHSTETKTTLPQLLHKMVSRVELNRQTGYYKALQQVETMADKVHTALLYSAYENVMFAKFHLGKWHHFQEPHFTDENRIVSSEQFFIRNGFVVFVDIPANLLTRKYA